MSDSCSDTLVSVCQCVCVFVCRATGADKILVQLTGLPLTLVDEAAQCTCVCVWGFFFQEGGGGNGGHTGIVRGSVQLSLRMHSCLPESTMLQLLS